MHSTPSKRYQQLQAEDRVTLASLVRQKYSVRAMAQLLGRPPRKLHRDGVLFGLMRHFLNDRWSPEQIALTRARIFPPKGHEHRVSHKTIYNCI